MSYATTHNRRAAAYFIIGVLLALCFRLGCTEPTPAATPIETNRSEVFHA